MRLTSMAVASSVGGDLLGDPAVVLSGAEVDSRLVREGDLFVALAGARVDGHTFVDGALKTASGALIRKDASLPPPPRERCHIVVDDPLAAYHRLAAEDRINRSWKVAAITGSVAKTTTKNFLVTLLEDHLRVSGSQGNRNSTLGLPAQLLSQPEDCEVFVAEAGMSHPGELDVLGAILQPDLLLYTRITAAHTEFFADISGVAEAKAELISHLSADGIMILNADDPHQESFFERTRARVVRYGKNAEARLDNVENRGLYGSRGGLVLPSGRTSFELAVPGLHQAENFLAAATAAAALGADPAAIAAAAGRLEAAPHRGRLLHLDDDIIIVDDSYNASPAAVARALDLLSVSPGRRIAVLGEMYELGVTSETAHRETGARAAAACDLLLAVGTRWATSVAGAARSRGLAEDQVYTAPDAETATATLRKLLQPGDVVLVKGSRSVGLDRTIAALLGGQV